MKMTMPSVCPTFLVHLPHPLKHYSFFDIGESAIYEDDAAIFTLLEKVATTSYLPANRIILKRIKEYKGDFRVSFSLSGTTLDQLERFRPEVLDSFKRLADTGYVEFVCEPYFHSLAFLFSMLEFREQVELHQQKMVSLFGQHPTAFINTELIYNDDVGHEAEGLGFAVILAKGTKGLLEGRPQNRVFQPDSSATLKLMLSNHDLSSKISALISGPSDPKNRLTAALFAQHLEPTQETSNVITWLLDLEIFGESSLHDTGALEFLDQLPGAMLARNGVRFETLTQAAKHRKTAESISSPGFTSWEEAERKFPEWVGNEMQKDALHALYLMEQEVKAHHNPAMLQTWRNLQTSDHFRYMRTAQLDEDVLIKATNPFHSPYDAYINFMNVLTDFSERLSAPPPQRKTNRGSES
ncbi:MAG: alpha-amylase [bacterium]